ncbi:hypothetical protein O181_085854 [Austropuccinia psidii MF-1]|uniref:Integrase catalytic domain-containing protein n=1 Tax=Austropuccinia psidii MF-1 TaxID=1389203 RepID=A0A9Q3FW40_9BASI|nr:hypothetical protein [Austropuccinia psidii MF-1]
MFNSQKFFLSLSDPTNIRVTTGDTNSSLKAVGVGKVSLMCDSRPLELDDCLYVPNLKCNLISLLALFKNKLTINRSNNMFSMELNNFTLLSGRIINQLMHVNYTIPKVHLTVTRNNLWHQRLGHPGPAVLKKLGLPTNDAMCTVCKLKKAHKQPFKEKFEDALSPLDCVHIDLVGPIHPASISGSQSFLSITDQATSYKITKFLGKKSDAYEEFLTTKTFLENQKDRRLKKLVSNRGGEFLNKRFELLARAHGFVHSFSPPETPQHNGFTEQSNKTILDKARCLLNSCNFPPECWAEAVNTAVLLSNLTPTQSRDSKSPYCLWTGQEPRLNQLRTFGCLAFMAIPKLHCSWKLAPAGERGALLGYKNDNTSYRILGLHYKKVAITKHATFDETSFPSLNQDNLNILPYSRRANILLTSLDTTPRTFKAALISDNRDLWKEAIDKELEAMVKLKVWEVTGLEDNRKLIGTTWIFKTKQNLVYGKKEYKARLCAQGFTQTPGIDYKKRYAPTGRLNSLRTLIAFAAANNLQFHQLDVKSTFLNAPLTKDVYLSIPQGLNICQQSHCLKLKKEIYVLRQAPFAWYDSLKKWLTSV